MRRRTYAAWFCTEHPRGIVVAGHADDFQDDEDDGPAGARVSAGT